jgi:uncharacterized membrane protein
VTIPRRHSLCVALLSAVCAALAAKSGNPVLDTIVSLPFVLYLPGATLMDAIDPFRHQVDGMLRHIWSIGASVGMVILGGLVLNLAGGLTRVHWLVLISGIVVVLAAVTWVRGGGRIAPDDPSETGTDVIVHRGAHDGPDETEGVQRVRFSLSLRQGAFLLGAVALVGGAMVLSLHSDAVATREHFVQAWVLPQPQNDPYSPSVQVGITNDEGKRTSFLVKELVGTKKTASYQVVVLNAGKSWILHVTRVSAQPVQVNVALSSQPKKLLATVSLASPT